MYKFFKKVTLSTFFLFLIISNLGFDNYKVIPYQNAVESVSNNEDDKILFIVDLSNSMNETINGIKKTDIAFNAFSTIISKLNPNIHTGLRVYGHKFGFSPMLGCTATELVSPVKENNASNIYQILSKMEANGWTPITRSLKNAVDYDFAGIQGNKRIILLTDGGENCDESPCDYAIKLIQTRNDIKIDIIEFAIDDPIAEAQLKCTALTTSGKLYKANDTESLAKSLEKLLNIETHVQGEIISK